MDKIKINSFKKSKINKLTAFALAFVCSFSFFFVITHREGAQAPVTASAYTEQSAFTSFADALTPERATSGVFTPLYAFDGFDTLQIGAYASGVPQNRLFITDFKHINQDGFAIKEGFNPAFNLIDTTAGGIYQAGVRIRVHSSEDDGTTYAVALYPQYGQAGVRPVIAIKHVPKNKTEDFAFVFPEYKPSLENGYGSIVIYKKTSVNEYGNPFPVFIGSPNYNATNKLATLKNYLFFPDKINRSEKGFIWFNEHKTKVTDYGDAGNKEIKLSVPAFGVWRWKTTTLSGVDFTNTADGQTVYTKPLTANFELPFVSLNAIYASLTVAENPKVVKYGSYTVFNEEFATEFVDENLQYLYMPDDAFKTTTFLYNEDGSTYFILKNFDFLVEAGQDEYRGEKVEQADIWAGITSIGVMALGVGLFLIPGAQAPAVFVFLSGALTAVGVSGKIFATEFFDDIFQQLQSIGELTGGMLQAVWDNGIVRFWDTFIVPVLVKIGELLPGAGKGVWHNVISIGVIILILTAIIGAILAIVKRKNK